MDQLVQCPVCTLFLHNGMSLESHLDTHPKDQVIKALCNLTSTKGSSYGSRTSTPMHSERSYRSRSRTPATDDSAKWPRSAEHDRYWRRTPSRTPKTTPLSNSSRNGTPDIRMHDVNFESHAGSGSVPGQHVNNPFLMKSDKIQQTYQSPPVPEYDPQYVYYPDQQEDREIKFSRSAEYNAMDNSNNLFYNVPTMGGPGTKLLPAVHRRANDLVKILPKPNNILLKSNMGGVQYIGPGVKPMHVMVPTAPTFVQKNVQSNMIMTGNLPNSQMHIGNKTAPPVANSQLNQMTSGAFTPGTTVVTQNSQIIYREMVHNLDGKPFVTSMPTVLSGHENVTNLTQASSLYQNVMVVDQFGNTSCMYTTPQQMMPKGCPASMYDDNGTLIPSVQMEKSVQNMHDPKTLIIEVGPLMPPPTNGVRGDRNSSTQHPDTSTSVEEAETPIENADTKCDSSVSTKGLKILSNIKVEVPVQHHKNMVNTVMDLTGSNESDYLVECVDTPNKVIRNLKENNQLLSEDTQPSSMSSVDSMTSSFSVIKNVGNPIKTSVDDKVDTEFSDSCPVPDLICNEKPSISPCSELSENGDNSTDHTSISPKPESSQVCHNNIELPKKVQLSQKPYRHNTLRLNNIFVKKHKKVLQIKNAKMFPNIKDKDEIDDSPTSSICRSPENFTMNKLHQADRSDIKEKSNILQTVSVEAIKQSDENNDFDADTEEQSMDIEPAPPVSLNQSNQFSTGLSDMVHVKEEINSSNEGGFSNETVTSDRILTPLETLRPINVISYDNGEFGEDSNDRELLDLEAASKNKQFVSMMNENYFGNDIYADYFTPDRVEAFDAERSAEVPKDGMYNIWGESSQKDNEFVLPNFIHESYKIAESNGIDYSELGGREVQVDAEVDGCERDSKADVLSEGRSESDPPMNICADERMPPRGELSGQESNGDMESPWSGIYTEVTPSEPYDLIARESWVSDGSEVDASEKREPIEEVDPLGARGGPGGQGGHACSTCGALLTSLKELRAHRASAHPACSKTTYRRLVAARTIKKEEKTDTITLSNSLLTLDSKESITSTILKVYDTCIDETKPKIEVDRLIKQEVKRRRKDYVCPTCKVDQETDAAFHAHLKIHPLECLTCGKCFFRRANLALHIKTHLGIKNYKCDVCEKRFVTRQKLMEHHNVHTGRAPFKCTICDDTFRRYSNMVQHRDRHHFHKRAKVRDFVCHCGAVFHSRAKLLWHKETHDARPKACLYCSDKFVHAASLTRHVRRAHNEYFLAPRCRQPNVACPVCRQVCLRANLRAHVATHAGARPHACVVCGKAFSTKWNLKLHRWTHASRSAKPYKCALCKGAFVRHSEYVSHMNAHKAVRPYTCNYCGCQFIRKYNCQRHVREHESAKKFVCKVAECGKSFHRSYYLSEHMKVHSGARPFACSICGKTSSNKSNHNKHVKIHHAREPVATEA